MNTFRYNICNNLLQYTKTYGWYWFSDKIKKKTELSVITKKYIFRTRLHHCYLDVLPQNQSNKYNLTNKNFLHPLFMFHKSFYVVILSFVQWDETIIKKLYNLLISGWNHLGQLGHYIIEKRVALNLRDTS